jgi:hypothetical protein
MNGATQPPEDPTAAPTVPGARRVVGWGLVFWGASQLAGAVFSNNATALVAVQAALAEWGAGRIGITWSDPLAAMPSGKAIARRVGLGAAMGAVAAAGVVGLALATGGAQLAPASPGFGSLAVGLVVAVLASVRDELFLRGLVLRATRGLLPAWASLAACGAAAAAARYGAEGVFDLSLLVAGLRGVALASVWVRDRGAWMAVGASAAWAWSLQSVVHGGLLDVRFGTESDAGVPGVVMMGIAAVVGLGVATGVASRWAVARRSPS